MDTEQVQITIEADVEYTRGNRTEIETKLYGPFNANLPKLTNPDMYKFMMYTLLQNNFTILSTLAITHVGARIAKHNPRHFKNHKVGALKLKSYFLDKQFEIKQRGDHTCMVDFVWYHCRGKRGFRMYNYEKLKDNTGVS